MEEIIDGYTKLIEDSSEDMSLTKADIKVYVDLIKSNLVNLFNALEKRKDSGTRRTKR